MKRVLAFVATMMFPSFGFAQTVSTPGVFENVSRSGDWMFAEIREFDGRLSGCFMSTSAIDGTFSFELADLNVLSLSQNGEISRKIAIVDIADETASEYLPPLGWFLKFGSPGDKYPSYLTPLAATESNKSNRFTFEWSVVDDQLLDAIANELIANFSIANRTVIYSLKGSGRAVALWRECDGNLR